MKIAVVINDITPSAGTERITSTICNSFAARGHGVTIVSCFREFADISYELQSGIKIVFINSYKKKNYSRIGRIISYFNQIRRIRRYFRHADVDVIIGQSFPINLILFFSGVTNKVIACEHIFYNYYFGPVRLVRNLLYRFFYRVVVLTEKDKVKFQKYISNVSVIPNMNLFVCDQKANLRNKRIISVGRLEKQKGFDLLLDAVKDIFIQHSDWQLNIFGEGPDYSELKSQINHLSLQKNVFLRGKTMDIKNEYLQSSIYVLSSRFEGFGLVLVEAAVCGLPVVSFDCPNGPSDILSPDLGVLVENSNIECLKSAILSLIEDENLRLKYAKKGQEIVEKYSEEKVYKKWEDLFENIK